MDAPRTPFAALHAHADRSAEVIPFPAKAVAWCRDMGEAVALVDAAGRVLRYRTEAGLHAAIIAQHVAATEQAQRLEAEELEIARREAFDTGHWLARLPYLIAGALPEHWVAACIGAATGSVTYLIRAAQ